MGYTYVMSDIHGMATLLERMLEKIKFSSGDSLYILGDMIDRGPDPGRVLDIVMETDNITALMGNHEDAFVSWYDSVREGSVYGYYYNTYDILSRSSFTYDRLEEYVEWMRGLPCCKKIKAGETNYLLAHASTDGIFSLRNRKEICLWDGQFVERQAKIPWAYSIVGHVPTFILRGYPDEEASIWHSADGKVADVDCGAVFVSYGGRLGCLCLETGEEFYVSQKDEEEKV